MSISTLDSPIQTTSSSINATPNNSISTKSVCDIRRTKTPYQTQKESVMKRKDKSDSSTDHSKSLSPKRRRRNDHKDNRNDTDLMTNSPLNLTRKKKVTFKGDFIKVIDVLSFKKYYVEELKQEHSGKCNCFIF